MKLSSHEEITRVTRSKAAARATYNRLSGIYDLLTGMAEDRFKQRGLQILQVLPGERVLEIGCGTGKNIVDLAKAVGENGRVDGLDLSPRMLDRTKERIQTAGLSERVRLFEGDAAEYPFEPGFYDAVFMSFVLELFDTPEIPLVLDSCNQALRPGGRICVVALSRVGGGWGVRLYEWGHGRFPAALDCRPIYAQDSIKQAGFEDGVTTRMRMFGLPVDIVLSKKRDY